MPEATVIGGQQSFSQLIKKLFANNEQGFFYDPNDLTTMYQDAAGTIPVTAAGQPVGLMLDKSKGLALGNELVVNGDFSNGETGWTAYEGTTISIVGGKIQVVNDNGSAAFAYQEIPTVVGKTYTLSVDIETVNNSAGAISVGSVLGQVDVATTIQGTGTLNIIFTAKSSVSYLLLQPWTNEIGKTCLFDNVSVKELADSHAYQTLSAMRPLLAATPQRLDYDTVDDKLITNLPAQLTGCTVVRSVPNVGTQILTGQTIPTTYEDNTDHCGLIVINRALTPSETSAIATEFNKRAGV